MMFIKGEMDHLGVGSLNSLTTKNELIVLGKWYVNHKSIWTCSHDQSFKDNVDFEDEKIITKQEDNNLYYLETEVTRALKIGVEP